MGEQREKNHGSLFRKKSEPVALLEVCWRVMETSKCSGRGGSEQRWWEGGASMTRGGEEGERHPDVNPIGIARKKGEKSGTEVSQRIKRESGSRGGNMILLSAGQTRINNQKKRNKGHSTKCNRVRIRGNI